MSIANESLKEIVNASEKNFDRLLDPTKYPNREEMGEDLRDLLGYDPTRIWDWCMMQNQMAKLTSEDGWKCVAEDSEAIIDPALEHYDNVKDYLMLQIAQRTIKDVYDKDVYADDLNLDLDYVLDNEIFGTGFDGDSEEDEDSLLDELDDDDDDFDDDEYDLVD